VFKAILGSLAFGVAARFALEAVLRTRATPPLVSDRFGWLILIGGLTVGAVAIFALVARSLRTAGMLAVVLVVLVGLAWDWQPAGVLFLATSLCVVIAVSAAVGGRRPGAVIVLALASVLAYLYARVAAPSHADRVETLIVVLVPVTVVFVHLMPASERERLRRLAVSTLPFLLAAGISGYYFRDSGRVSDRLPSGEVPDESPEEMAEYATALVFSYAPVLVFTRNEKWRPVIGSSYTINATGRDVRTGKEVPIVGVSFNPKRYDLAGCRPQDPCYEIVNPCFPESPPEERESCADEQLGGGNRYDMFRRELQLEESPRHFAGKLPYPDVQYLLQYWMFYPYNRWRSPEGLVDQQHAGDWEAITVGLSRKRPLFVAYSSHCGGEWRDWKEVRAVGTEPETGDVDWDRPGTHPVAWVAEGSHAMYPTDGDAVPNWTGCSKTFKNPLVSWLARVGLSGSARETISHELTASAREGQVQPASRYQVLHYPGKWGREDSLSIAGRTVHEGHGPLSPSCQNLWIDPLWTIFCHEHWEGPSNRCNGRRKLTGPNPCGGSFPDTGPDVPF
jgi:hypothetical protein